MTRPDAVRHIQWDLVGVANDVQRDECRFEINQAKEKARKSEDGALPCYAERASEDSRLQQQEDHKN